MTPKDVLHRLIQGARAFRTRVVLRVVFLGATLWLLFYILAKGTYHLVVPIVVGFVLLYQLYALVHYVERANRDLSALFERHPLRRLFPDLCHRRPRLLFRRTQDRVQRSPRRLSPSAGRKGGTGPLPANRGAAHWRRLDRLRQRWRGVADQQRGHAPVGGAPLGPHRRSQPRQSHPNHHPAKPRSPRPRPSEFGRGPTRPARIGIPDRRPQAHPSGSPRHWPRPRRKGNGGLAKPDPRAHPRDHEFHHPHCFAGRHRRTEC